MANPYGLTTRETEIVALLVGGRTAKDVAKLLDVKPRQIARIRLGAMRKFHARNAIHLAHLAAVAGLIQVSGGGGSNELQAIQPL